jgi:hypothetical protein
MWIFHEIISTSIKFITWNLTSSIENIKKNIMYKFHQESHETILMLKKII